jgi:hypothetical protein
MVVFLLILLLCMGCQKKPDPIELSTCRINQFFLDYLKQDDYYARTSIVGEDEQIVLFETSQNDDRRVFGIGAFYVEGPLDDPNTKIQTVIATANQPTLEEKVAYTYVKSKTYNALGLYFSDEDLASKSRQAEVTYTTASSPDVKSVLVTYEEAFSDVEVFTLHKEEAIVIKTIELFDGQGHSLYFVECE